MRSSMRAKAVNAAAGVRFAVPKFRFPNFPNEGKAILFGHPDIAQNDVVLIALKECQALRRACGCINSGATAFQHHLYDFPGVGLVVDRQHEHTVEQGKIGVLE